MKNITLGSSFPTIGILGGGQLAKMLSQAAMRLGIATKVMARNKTDVLPGLSDQAIIGNWNDPSDALKFSQRVDIVILENEFINLESLEAIEQAGIPIFPSTSTLGLIQDKWIQKQTLLEAGLPVVACSSVNSADDVIDFASIHNWPVVLKRRHESYDGKGNATVHNKHELIDAWTKLSINNCGLFVEAFCPFIRELAVMACRSPRGQTVVYPVVDTEQKNHVCHTVRAPSSLAAPLAEKVKNIAMEAITSIHGFGSMGVELFLAADNHILVNELAPRVHNTGHFTIEACHCSQFENHIRSVLNLPLGSTDMIRPAAAMINLLGDGDGPAVPFGLQDALAVAGAHIHIYGKNRSSKGRKMGHVTALGDSIEQAEQIAQKAASCIRFGNSSHSDLK